MTEAVRYPLERLYADQDRDWVVDAVPYVLAWVSQPSLAAARQPVVFDVAWKATTAQRRLERVSLSLTWDLTALAAEDAGLTARVERLRARRTVDREAVTRNAAEGLALVAVSVFLPGRRVVHMNVFSSPDLVLDAVTPGALRGVEVAGITRGGPKALSGLRAGTASKPGKRAELLARPDIAEVHLSLWGGASCVAEMYKIKP
ncbi:MAG: hypothetical protein U0324_10585 [Polyangiales bacterium]